jgi:hypothetical protein
VVGRITYELIGGPRCGQSGSVPADTHWIDGRYLRTGERTAHGHVRFEWSYHHAEKREEPA